MCECLDYEEGDGYVCEACLGYYRDSVDKLKKIEAILTEGDDELIEALKNGK